MRRFTALLGVPLILIAACARTDGSDPGGPGGPADQRWAAFQHRADAVADAWRSAAGRQEWLAGYAPLQDSTVLPGEPGFTSETQQAFLAGWYQLEVQLPTGAPVEGTVTFPDGSLAVPLISAADAYAAIRQGDPPQCPADPPTPGRPGPDPTATSPDGTVTDGPDDSVTSSELLGCQALTVTEVTLGTVDLLTSRGTAQVPAWLFEIAELDTPVARVAVDEVVNIPTPSPDVVQATDLTDFVVAQNLTDVEGTELGYSLGVGACDRDITPFVQEYADAVVVAGSVVRTGEMCTDQLLFHPVTVTLDEPVGDRTVLDAVTGQPLQLGAVG